MKKFFLRFFIFLLLPLIFISNVSCHVRIPRVYPSKNICNSINNRKEYERISTSVGYESLRDEYLKIIYDNLAADVSNITSKKDSNNKYLLPEIFIPGDAVTKQDVKQVLIAFHNDRPEVFWLSKTYVISTSSMGCKINFLSEFSMKNMIECKNKLDMAVTDFLQDLPLGLSEYERELWIHDKLVKKCKYNKAGIHQSNSNDYTSFGALVLQSCVCEGYSKSMKLLLNKVGIKCETVIGYGKTELHMWNAVNIEGEWYHLDTTWDSNLEAESRIHDYFNLDSKTILKDHVLNFKSLAKNYEEILDFNCLGLLNEYLGVKKFNSKKFNYFNIEAVKYYKNDNNSSKIFKKLIELHKKKQPFIHIQFENNNDIEHFLSDAANNFVSVMKELNHSYEFNDEFRIMYPLYYSINKHQNVVNFNVFYNS